MTLEEPDEPPLMLICADCDREIGYRPDHIYLEGRPDDLIAFFCDACGEERGLERIDLVKERKLERN